MILYAFNDIVNGVIYTTLSVKMILNDEFVGLWKEAPLA
jgi:hypothetical protein